MAERANNRAYITNTEYTLTVIELVPDGTLPDKVLEVFPMANTTSAYVIDNVYHTSLTLFYN